jgi:hypothetical protein
MSAMQCNLSRRAFLHRTSAIGLGAAASFMPARFAIM